MALKKILGLRCLVKQASDILETIQALGCGNYLCDLKVLLLWNRAREIDKCKSVQPFHKQSAISVSFTETTDRPFLRSWKLPIGSFRNDRRFLIYGKECILTLNSIIFPSYTLFLVIYGFKKNGIEY